MTGGLTADRARGALFGLAIGDALGMPTESLPRAEIVRRYGSVIDGFHEGAPDQPLAPGLPAGSVTDDTEQAVMLGRLLVESGGALEPRAVAAALLDWEKSMRARGSLGLLGPSTRRALDALAAGADIAESGRAGTTNGAAMRIAPVGVATPADRDDLLLARVIAASMATHHTGVALAGAAAVAAAVSAGVSGASVPEAVGAGAAAADVAAGRGYWVAAADVGERIRWASGLTAGVKTGELIDLVYGLVGTSLASQESVPAAFTFAAACAEDAWAGCRLAASVGGDCDTIAAMTGAILGACLGEDAFPAAARRLVTEVNGLDLPGLAAGLLAVREGRAAARQGRRIVRADMTGPEPGAGRPRLLYLGNVVVDIVFDVAALPERGGDMFATRTRYLAGGGFNVMASAARQGLPVSYAGALGTGPFAELARTAISAEGIEMLLPPRPDLDTGFVIALVEPGGERTFVSSRGAEATLTADDLAGITPGRGDIIGLSGYSLAHEANRRALTAWLDACCGQQPVIFDPGPLAGTVPEPALRHVLARTTWLTCNEREAKLLTGEREPRLAIRALLALLGRPAGASDEARGGGVLIRLGPAGCLVGQPGQPVRSVPGFQVRATDTNGAGDAHAGVFIAAVAAGLPVLEAVRRANAGAAVSVTRPGPAASPDRAELDAFMASDCAR